MVKVQQSQSLIVLVFSQSWYSLVWMLSWSRWSWLCGLDYSTKEVSLEKQFDWQGPLVEETWRAIKTSATVSGLQLHFSAIHEEDRTVFTDFIGTTAYVCSAIGINWKKKYPPRHCVGQWVLPNFGKHASFDVIVPCLPLVDNLKVYLQTEPENWTHHDRNHVFKLPLKTTR